jgi:hypothetical protein
VTSQELSAGPECKKTSAMVPYSTLQLFSTRSFTRSLSVSSCGLRTFVFKATSHSTSTSLYLRVGVEGGPAQSGYPRDVVFRETCSPLTRFLQGQCSIGSGHRIRVLQENAFANLSQDRLQKEDISRNRANLLVVLVEFDTGSTMM